MAIYVQRNDQKLGPFTVAEVRSQLASGALSLKDHVWWTGQTGWVPLVGSEVLKPGFEDPDPAMRKKDDGMSGLSPFSIAALVAGLLFPFSFFTSVPAIVFGHCALYEIKKNPGRTGKSLAIIGLALGYFFTLLSAAAVGWYYYDYDKIEAIKYRQEAVDSVPFVPPVPKAAPPAPAPEPPPPPAPAPAPEATPAPAAVPPAPDAVPTPVTNAAPATPTPAPSTQ